VCFDIRIQDANLGITTLPHDESCAGNHICPGRAHVEPQEVFRLSHAHSCHLATCLELPLLSLSPLSQSRLRLRLESLREPPHIPLDWSMVSQELHIRPIDQQLARSALLLVLVPTQRGEPPILADDDLLAAREFVLGTAEGFDGCCAVLNDVRISPLNIEGRG